MKVQKKITFVLCVIIIIFIAFLVFRYRSDREYVELLRMDKAEQLQKLLLKIVEIKGKPLEMQVRDYTYWDDMVNFVRTGDRKWAAENLDEVLKTYKENATWVYRMDNSLVYSANSLGDKKLEEIPVPQASIGQLFSEDRFCHFFALTSHGVMEIQGATIHPTNDPERKTPPAGYYFVGMLLDEKYFGEIQRVLEAKIKIVPVDRTSAPNIKTHDVGVIAVSNSLMGWDGKNVARIFAESVSLAILQLDQSVREQFVIALLFSLTVLTVISFVLMRWVNAPLRLITESLEKQNTFGMSALKQQHNEYGHIARLEAKFFDQKAELEREIAEHRRIGDELKIANARLEQWGERLEGEVEQRTDTLRKYQEKLMRQERLAFVGQLASSVSHELRSPLTAIKNTVYLLNARGISKESVENADALALINREVDACVRVISDILDFVRVKEPVKKEIRLRDIINESLSLNLIPESITVTTEVPPELQPVNADPIQIRQVFDNMVRNAVQAMENGGRLTIKMRSDGAIVTVEFADTGVGISDENLKKIFDPLFSTFPRGTGLGLPVCQQIIEAHDGSIEVESEVGKGTVFRIKLPVK